MSLLLLNVDVIVDVILAVAVVPLALTAIAEFQLWIRYIRAATHGAAMVIVLLFLLLLGCLGDMEVDNLRPLGLGLHPEKLLQLQEEYRIFLILSREWQKEILN